MFVRFVTSSLHKESHKRLGVIHAALNLLRSKKLSIEDYKDLRALVDWFNKHLNPPNRFARSRKRDARSEAISWFKDSAKPHISRMRMICRILNENGIPTTMLTTTRPGYIVFEDRHQIAAAPFAETTA